MGAALRIFCEMPNHGCPQDSDTYGPLINGLCKLGKIGEAKELFNEMETKGCLPSVVTYTSLIHGFCQTNNLDEAVGSLMDGLCKGGHSSQAMELLGLMVSKRHKPNNITYSTLLHGFCEEGKLQEALEILDRMKLQGMKPDAGLYGKMVLRGVSPNRLTWSLHVRIHNAVVQDLCSSGDPNRACQLYVFFWGQDLVSCILACVPGGDLHKAYQIVDEMVLDGCVPDEGIWSSMVDGFWNCKKVRGPAELLQAELMSEMVDPET
ncbi:unnamed protein product [Prunus armeniaca]|uniref:Pentacotripeptide-repeat region of PRORP domain-containing protein n=1 Tax=Prunus armeniaca TaxID=36596 RepID=A0A6J5XQC7_PRUAR|nr:unnamed protein product [Prunus armeniaca]